MYIVYCILYIVYCAKCILYIVHKVQNVLYCVMFKMYTVYCVFLIKFLEEKISFTVNLISVFILQRVAIGQHYTVYYIIYITQKYRVTKSHKNLLQQLWMYKQQASYLAIQLATYTIYSTQLCQCVANVFAFSMPLCIHCATDH